MSVKTAFWTLHRWPPPPRTHTHKHIYRLFLSYNLIASRTFPCPEAYSPTVSLLPPRGHKGQSAFFLALLPASYIVFEKVFFVWEGFQVLPLRSKLVTWELFVHSFGGSSCAFKETSVWVRRAKVSTWAFLHISPSLLSLLILLIKKPFELSDLFSEALFRAL